MRSSYKESKWKRIVMYYQSEKLKRMERDIITKIQNLTINQINNKVLSSSLEEKEKRIQHLLNENSKIIQENSQYKSESEKSRQGLADMVNLYKKEKKEKEKRDKIHEELKKVNQQLMSQMKMNQSPFVSPMKSRDSMTEITNK
jgi:hypothetical protein